MKRERLEQIFRYIESREEATTQELTDAFQVSTMTIRRALGELEEQGRIIRYHGGAKAVQISRTEASFDLRSRTNHEEKMAIARRGIALLKQQRSPESPVCIFMGAGSSVYCMASQLDVKLTKPIVTDNLYAATMLESCHENMVVMTGGQLMQPSMNAAGDLAEKCLSDLALDIAFVGTSAIDAEGNFYAYNETESGMCSKIFAASKQVVILADYSKLGQQKLVHVKKLDGQFTLITDSKANPEYLQHYRQLGARVIVADE